MGPLPLRISVSHIRPPPEPFQTDPWSSIVAVWISKMEALTPYIPPALLPLAQTLHDQIPLVGVALVSLGAIYLGYIYILGKKEAAVLFNVPIPPEVRTNWKGKAWEDAQGEEKKVLEGQLRGVGLLVFIFVFLRAMPMADFNFPSYSCGMTRLS